MRTHPSAAIILAGGRARRFGGADKPAAQIGGRAVLARVLEAVGDRPIVVVGATSAALQRPGLRWTREDPPYSGPVAGIAAGLPLIDAETTLILAADLPFLSAHLLDQLCDAAGDTPLAVVRRDGAAQWLTSAWQTTALRRRLAEVGDPAGLSVRRLIGDLPMALVDDPAPGGRPLSFDVDTPDDLRQARTWAMSDDELMRSLRTWTESLRVDLGIEQPVDDATLGTLLKIASVAAHQVVRPAAPVTTYLIGLAIAADPALTPADALARVQRLADPDADHRADPADPTNFPET